jgi:hypothetical protein
MIWLKNIYNQFFLGFILSVVIVFFTTRELNSPWQRFIAGDGLGYYAYLPAKYIYNDKNYDFKWFNKVYANYYLDNGFASADDNFLVKYKNKKINKYYQGLSALWLPFFAVAHMLAKVFNFPADGYSQPYQMAIGLASLCYLFLGLFYLKKLLLKMFHSQLVSIVIPMVIFYGTFLFHYTIDLNSLSHVYSFTFISIFIYYTYLFFNGEKNLRYFLICTMCLVIIVCIRPLNGLIVLTIPAFFKNKFLKEKFIFSKIKLPDALVILITVGFIINQLYILYAQVGTFFADTYSNEKFYFNNPRLFDVLISYHAGLFVYVPIIFLSVFGVFYLQSIRKGVILLLLFFLVVYLYSSWWYWPITTRSLIDYYPLMAILLGALLKRVENSGLKRFALIVVMVLMVAYHQLKSMQLHNGILDGNLTHCELFWKNFFKTHRSNIYAIPPSSIIKNEIHFENFEGNAYTALKTDLEKHSGKYSALLDSSSQYSKAFEYKIPGFFKETGIRKIRLSFWCYFTKNITITQIYFNFYDKNKALVKAVPFYINKDLMRYNKWDYKEFGCDLFDEEIKAGKITQMGIFVWDNEQKNSVYLDDVKIEFVLTDKSFELVQ